VELASLPPYEAFPWLGQTAEFFWGHFTVQKRFYQRVLRDEDDASMVAKMTMVQGNDRDQIERLQEMKTGILSCFARFVDRMNSELGSDLRMSDPNLLYTTRFRHANLVTARGFAKGVSLGIRVVALNREMIHEDRVCRRSFHRTGFRNIR